MPPSPSVYTYTPNPPHSGRSTLPDTQSPVLPATSITRAPGILALNLTGNIASSDRLPVGPPEPAWTRSDHSDFPFESGEDGFLRGKKRSPYFQSDHLWINIQVLRTLSSASLIRDVGGKRIPKPSLSVCWRWRRVTSQNRRVSRVCPIGEKEPNWSTGEWLGIFKMVRA